jgi:hypothetical protein
VEPKLGYSAKPDCGEFTNRNTLPGAEWLQRADQSGSLGTFLNPPLTLRERDVAAVEGWIYGIV